MRNVLPIEVYLDKNTKARFYDAFYQYSLHSHIYERIEHLSF